jgi:hypothetical protein
MKAKDTRLNLINESFNNIKMLKINAWTDHFASKISESRATEMEIFWKRNKVTIASISSMYFFPQILSAIVFSIYIGTGH